MSGLSERPAGNVIIFCFCGGVRDGDAVRSDQSPEGANEASAFWQLTWNGTVGRRFDVPVPNAHASQRYQVKSKHEVGGEIHVTCEHVG